MSFSRRPIKPYVIFSVLGIALITSFVAALCLGAVPLSTVDIWRGLWEENSTSSALIVQHIRLPRALLALVIGATLALCGCVTQSLFRNPLADPSLIGVSAGASVGASVAIFLGAGSYSASAISSIDISIVSLAAFAGGALAVLFVYRLSTTAFGTSVPTMLLAGIAIGAIAGSLGSLLEYYSNNEDLRRMSLWRMGGLDSANMMSVGIAASVMLLSAVFLQLKASALDALLLGESEARHLGIPVNSLKVTLILIVAVGVGLSVAIAGLIGFVGLVVPHMVRLTLGPGHRLLLPCSALSGAILLCVADTLARTIAAPAELPVGLLTALLGAPVFISLLRQGAANRV